MCKRLLEKLCLSCMNLQMLLNESSSLDPCLTLGTGLGVNESKIDSVGPNGPAGTQLSQAGSDTYQQMCRAANDMGNPS